MKTFINVFPSEDFLEYIILVETNFYKNIEKDSFIDSIKNEIELVEFIKNKNIKIPDKIKIFSLDLK